MYNSLGGVRGVNFIQYRNLSETEMQDLSSYKTVEIHMVRKKVQHCCNKCFLSLGLEVFLEDIVGGSFLAPVSDDARGTLDHLPGLALAVNLAQTGPLAQLHVAVHLGAGKKQVLVKLHILTIP